MNEKNSQSSAHNFTFKLTEKEKKKKEERLLYLFRQDPTTPRCSNNDNFPFMDEFSRGNARSHVMSRK